MLNPIAFLLLSPDSIFQRSEQSPDCKGRVLFFTKDFLLKNILNVHQLESFLFSQEMKMLVFNLINRMLSLYCNSMISLKTNGIMLIHPIILK